MYFKLLFQVISCSCFRFTPAAPTIVHSVLHGCPDWPVISTYTLHCLLSTIHARGSRQLIHLSGLCFPIRVMPNDQKQSEDSSGPAEVSQTSSGDSGGNSAVVDQVFSMFKDFLEKKLEDKGKQIEQRSKLDKEVVQLKFKGNQKQFELNAELDAIFESIETESESIEPNLSQIKKLSQEGRQRIRKRQKLIKIADKSRDGWQVVAEYESDELASGSEDEKRLKKAREAASRKRRQKEQLSSDRGKKPRIALGADNQLFRGKKKSLLFTLYIHMCFGSACASYHISRAICLYYRNLRVK